MYERRVNTAGDLRDAAAEIMALSYDGSDVLLVAVERKKNTRSQAANRWYWGVLIKSIREHIYESTGRGFSAEDVHAELKERFGELVLRDKFDGSQVVEPLSTTKYTVAQFCNFCARVEAYAVSDLGVRLPANPDEYLIYGAECAAA